MQPVMRPFAVCKAIPSQPDRPMRSAATAESDTTEAPVSTRKVVGTPLIEPGTV